MKAPRDEIGNALIALKKKGYPIVAPALTSSRPSIQTLSLKWVLRKDRQ